MAIKNFKLKVPATSANLGPGFDTLGVALSLYLTIEGTYNPQEENKVTFNCSGEGAELMPNDLEKNLITQCALFVLKNNGIDSVKGELVLNIHNEIPLGRGLGSSGAAVVGGVILGDIIGSLELSQSRIIDFIQELEGHPDNVVPAYLGGLVASYVSNKKQDSQVFPPQDIVRFSHLKWSKNIKVIAVVPKYELATSKARGVLPQNYSKQDVVFNLQRLAVLTSSLTQEIPDAELIYGAMDDCIHQPYRLELIPGLKQVLEQINPKTEPGTLGICLSGAGPTVLILSNQRQEEIAKRCQQILKTEGNVDSYALHLEVDFEGAQTSVANLSQ